MAKQNKSNTVKVRFIKSPTGAYGLGYNVDDVHEFDSKQAEEMIETGHAEKV